MTTAVPRIATVDPPFVHVFSSRGCYYAYDVNTNRILAIEPVLAAVLPLFGQLPEREIVERLGKEHGRSTVRGALAAVVQGRKRDGLFLPRTVKLVARKQEPGSHDSKLRHLILTVTERCNLRCRYCLHGAGLEWVRPHGRRDMGSETAKKALRYFLDRADPQRQPVVSFYGGEPLLVPGLIRQVVTAGRTHTRGDEILFAIDTNGFELSAETVSLIQEQEIHLQVSLDGPRQIHDRHRRDTRGQPSFDLIMANLDRLLTSNPEAADRLSFVITLTPGADLEAVAEFFSSFPTYRRRGIATQPRVRVNRADLSGQNWPRENEGWRTLDRQVVEARETYLNAVRGRRRDELSPVIRALFEPAVIRLHHRSGRPLGAAMTPGGNCRPGVRKLHVGPDGAFQPCERTGHVAGIGELDGRMEGALIDQLDARFQQAVRPGCADCWALRLCGVCYAVLGPLAVAADGAAARLCKQVRARREEELALFAEILTMPPESRRWLDHTAVD